MISKATAKERLLLLAKEIEKLLDDSNVCKYLQGIVERESEVIDSVNSSLTERKQGLWSRFQEWIGRVRKSKECFDSKGKALLESIYEFVSNNNLLDIIFGSRTYSLLIEEVSIGDEIVGCPTIDVWLKNCIEMLKHLQNKKLQQDLKVEVEQIFKEMKTLIQERMKHIEWKQTEKCKELEYLWFIYVSFCPEPKFNQDFQPLPLYKIGKYPFPAESFFLKGF